MSVIPVLPTSTRQEVRLPDVAAYLGDLSGPAGNAYEVLGSVCAALRAHGYAHLRETFIDEATAGDYDNLLAVARSWVVCLEDEPVSRRIARLACERCQA